MNKKFHLRQEDKEKIELERSKKYKRSLHADISLGTTSDDRFMPDNFFKVFQKQENVFLEKLDGQNNCFNNRGLFARSHVLPSELPWDIALRNKYKQIKNDLKELEIFGEGMYGVHSIHYTELESYFYVFGVRIKDTWLSWEEVKEVAEMFDFPTVPEIIQNKSLSKFNTLDDALTDALGIPWTDWTNTNGNLGGQDSKGNPAAEGLVIRNANEFKDISLSPLQSKIYPNEFADLFKLVRSNHVQTDEHWTKNWLPQKLKNYQKYGWDRFSYLSTK